MKNGVPWDVAFGLEDVDRYAFTIIFGELDGNKFNWSTMEWEKPGR